MSFQKMKPFWAAGMFSALVFVSLFAIRADLFNKMFPDASDADPAFDAVRKEMRERDSWMNIFQNGRKIGYSHSVLSKKEEGYRLQETVFMRINTLGVTQDVNLATNAVLNPDFTLSSLAFKMSSGLFDLEVEARVSGKTLSLSIKSSGSERTADMPLEKKPYITAGLMDAVRAAEGKPGDAFFFDIFDPSTMSQETVTVNVMSKESITSMGSTRNATLVMLDFKGATQRAWIGDDGEVLKEEGILGITLVKTDRNDAVFGTIAEAGEDLTKVASVKSNVRLADPSGLDVLKVEISGIPHEKFPLDGDRQRLEGKVLTIRKESLSDIPESQTSEPAENLSEYLKASTFIQSDHEKIRNLAEKIVSSKDTRLEKARKLMRWIFENIEKRPVLSLPDAMSTLENRMGDCNEHAVLFAALARAAGIPAKVEAGLVYLDGRFYYHAWNSLHVGKWVSADAVFGQMPADVTHIRFASGEQENQLDLIGIMGKVGLRVIGE